MALRGPHIAQPWLLLPSPPPPLIPSHTHPQLTGWLAAFTPTRWDEDVRWATESLPVRALVYDHAKPGALYSAPRNKGAHPCCFLAPSFPPRLPRPSTKSFKLTRRHRTTPAPQPPPSLSYTHTHARAHCVAAGSEASSYLQYVVDHYDCLPRWTLFLHGHGRTPVLGGEGPGSRRHHPTDPARTSALLDLDAIARRRAASAAEATKKAGRDGGGGSGGGWGDGSYWGFLPVAHFADRDADDGRSLHPAAWAFSAAAPRGAHRAAFVPAEEGKKVLRPPSRGRRLCAVPQPRACMLPRCRSCTPPPPLPRSRRGATF